MLEQLKKQLGTLPQITALAQKNYAPPTRPKINTHIHLPPNFSAFQTVRQAVELAAEQHIGLLGVSNYYDYDVYADFIEQTLRHRIFPLFGLETIALIEPLRAENIRINDPANPGKMYICGKGITRFESFTPKAAQIIEIIRRNDSQRMARMITRLAHIFTEQGLKNDLTEQTVIDMVVKRHGSPPSTVYLQERHLAQACQEELFRIISQLERSQVLARVLNLPFESVPGDHVKIQNEIRSQLMKVGKPAYVEETFIDLPQAYALILQMGGIPCYPVLADGTKPICEYEQDIDKLAEQLRQQNIHCVELIPLRNSPEALTKYTTKLRRLGFAVTAGTEHNTLDLIQIEPTCAHTTAVPEGVKEIFAEGAYVLAAHQFLALHHQCGFVDGSGKVNPAYETAEQRISAFARLGAAVVQKYFDAN